MLIRSQNKEGILNFDNNFALFLVVNRGIGIKEHYETEVRCSRGDASSEGILGKYSTKEKAIKVFDMIQDAYKSTMKMSISADTGISCIPVPVVFQMPQDSEVQDD